MKDRKGMSSRKYRFSDLFWILCISLFVTGIWARAAETSPNVVVIFLDDSSWADFQPLGDPFYEIPNVEYSNEMWRFHPTNPEHWGKFPLQFWDRGEVMKALRGNGLEENAIVVFSSDNGPWSGYGNHAGKTPFREAKSPCRSLLAGDSVPGGGTIIIACKQAPTIEKG